MSFDWQGRWNIPDQCSRVKLDIGLSYSAPQSQQWLCTEKDLMVFGFEPHPTSVAGILQGNIRGNASLDHKFIEEGRFQIIPVAVSDVDKEEEMDLYCSARDCGTSSLFSHDEAGELGPISHVATVPVISLRMFLDNFPWDRFEYIEYIKIDAQGSDLSILKSAGDYLKDKVVYVTAEPDGHQYHGASCCNTKNITDYMVSQNFTPINHPHTHDPTFLNNAFRHLQDEIWIYQR